MDKFKENQGYLINFPGFRVNLGKGNRNYLIYVVNFFNVTVKLP